MTIHIISTASGLEKVGDVPQPCLDPEHNPPSNIVLEPGVYRNTCPSCGQSSTFTVPAVAC